jgi:hypothetical protein
MTRSLAPQRLVHRRLAGVLVVCGALALGAAGCGDSGPDAPATQATPADDFVGTWRYLDVQSVLQCAGADPTNQPPDPNKTFAHGIGAAVVDLSPSPLLQGVFCDYGFDVSGAVATAQPGQTCALTSLDSLTIDEPQDQAPLWTFTLNSATTAEELATTTAHFFVAGAPTTCSWTLVGHLTRISKD